MPYLYSVLSLKQLNEVHWTICIVLYFNFSIVERRLTYEKRKSSVDAPIMTSCGHGWLVVLIYLSTEMQVFPVNKQCNHRRRTSQWTVANKKDTHITPQTISTRKASLDSLIGRGMSFHHMTIECYARNISWKDALFHGISWLAVGVTEYMNDNNHVLNEGAKRASKMNARIPKTKI